MEILKQVVKNNSVILKKVTFKLSDFGSLGSHEMEKWINWICEYYFYAYNKQEMWGKDLKVSELRGMVEDVGYESDEVKDFLFNLLSDIDLINIEK